RARRDPGPAGRGDPRDDDAGSVRFLAVFRRDAGPDRRGQGDRGADRVHRRRWLRGLHRERRWRTSVGRAPRRGPRAGAQAYRPRRGCIALAYVPTALWKVGAVLAVRIRGKDVPATVVKTPFYRRPE